MLDGFELAAAAWERAVLPARIDRYDPSLLDMLCLAGEVGWARLSAPKVLTLASVTPVALFLREHADAWHALRPPDDRARRGGASATMRERCLDSCGAAARRSSTTRRAACGSTDRLRQAIGVLVGGRGLAASDGFSGLRVLMAAARARRRDRIGGPISPDAGRHFASPGSTRSPGTPQSSIRRGPLRRYGVVFRRLLAREPNAAPWRELTPRLPAARGARRDPRRPLRLRHGGRAVRAAGRGPDCCARSGARRHRPHRDDRHRRSAQPRRHRHRRRPGARRRP